jgi:polysaccharide export outer membrane protein
MLLAGAAVLGAQAVPPSQPTPKQPAKSTPSPRATSSPRPTPSPAPTVVAPPDYVIGPDDVLTIVFWREKDMSIEVAVRPDGMITIPLINDIQAAGLKTEQLRERITEAAKKYLEDPNVMVGVREIKSRRVFITGEVRQPGPYPLTAPTTVLQLLAQAGGLTEYAKREDILVMRTEGGRSVSFKFNYKDVSKGKNLRQNIELKPGDTVVVP